MGYPAGIHRAWHAAAERVYRAVQPNRSIRMVIPVSVGRPGAGARGAADWMWTYNHERPNMALGGFTPKQRLAMAA
jgi:transposase InsO family protein